MNEALTTPAGPAAPGGATRPGETARARRNRAAAERRAALLRKLREEQGIATAEFSIVTLAAVGFAGLLVAILGSGEVRGMLVGLIRQAIGG